MPCFQISTFSHVVFCFVCSFYALSFQFLFYIYLVKVAADRVFSHIRAAESIADMHTWDGFLIRVLVLKIKILISRAVLGKYVAGCDRCLVVAALPNQLIAHFLRGISRNESCCFI